MCEFIAILSPQSNHCCHPRSAGEPLVGWFVGALVGWLVGWLVSSLLSLCEAVLPVLKALAVAAVVVVGPTLARND